MYMYSTYNTCTLQCKIFIHVHCTLALCIPKTFIYYHVYLILAKKVALFDIKEEEEGEKEVPEGEQEDDNS